MCLVKTTHAVTGNDLPRDTRIQTGIQALNISNQFLSLIILALALRLLKHHLYKPVRGQRLKLQAKTCE